MVVVADPLAIHSKLSQAEERLARAQAACDQLRAELDRALAERGWRRLTGVFTPHAAPRYQRTGGLSVSLSQALAEIERGPA